ncbi:MAG: hypothetical protein P9X22_00585 [Candidatus Zapsychrus exili]|nr:hypothetical protein [Candidatus Zapsychrus exili]
MKKNETVVRGAPKLVGRNLSPEEREARAAKERAETAETGLLFNLKRFAVCLSQGNTTMYFDKITTATISELVRFKKVIRQYKKDLAKVTFSNSRLTIYDILKAAINHELLRRKSILFKIYSLLLPLRKVIAWQVGHRKSHYYKEFGIIFVYKYTHNFFYAPISKHVKALWRFWLLHWKWLLQSSGGIGLGYLLLKLYRYLN